MIFLNLLWVHWFSDFVLQTVQMAMNKSKSNYWLTVHVLVYAFPFLWFGWKFALLNGVAHWMTDWVTSRINSWNWQAKRVHYFFVGVGLDQVLHYTVLFYSARYLLGA